MWHEQYGGEGVPAFAAKRPMPFALLPYQKVQFPQGYWTPEVSTVFDNFWADKDGLLGAWAAAWKLVAQHYRNQPYSMGYDLINEPWAGTEWASCLTTGCEPTYAQELQPAMERGLRAVRQADGKNVVWWEPQQFAGGQKLDTYYKPVRGGEEPRLLLAQLLPRRVLREPGHPRRRHRQLPGVHRRPREPRDRPVRRMNAAALMTEWGATDNVNAIGIDTAGCGRGPDGLDLLGLQALGRPDHGRRLAGPVHRRQRPGTVKMDKLRQLVRTYPQATAGVPTR